MEINDKDITIGNSIKHIYNNILLILNIFPIFLSSQCTSNTNCFSCNSNNICKWDLNKCIDNETLSSSKNILNSLLQCYDYSENFYFIYQYCGNTELILQKKKN